MSKTVTLIIHGTFAKQAEWWRLGNDGHSTFADRLESELSGRGLSGTVWKPALAEGFDYPSLSWSGLNRHRDRVRGALQLSSSLNQFAERVQATADAPLTVNFVAHSHGGNVVLEALRHLQPNVRVGRVALLGTPLVTVRPAFRIAQFIFSTILLALLFLLVVVLLIHFGSFVFTGHFFEASRIIEREGRVIRETGGGITSTLLFPLALIGYGWIFWALGNLLDVIWRIICRLGQPVAWLRGKARSLVYGPSPRKLATILGGRPILLVTSYNDEADLLLQVGSAPAQLYREYVATEFSITGRALEFVFLRPFVQGVLLKALEMMLEVLSLGFSPWRALVQNFEVASLDEQPYYPAPLLVSERLDVHPKTGAPEALGVEPTRHDRGMVSSAVGRHNLPRSLQEVTEELKRQVQLRHSTYYTDDAVIARVAAFLTGAEASAPEPVRTSTLRPSPEFWEALLMANVGLAAFYVWLIGRHAQIPLAALAGFIFLAGYILPFACLGVGLAFYFAVRQRMSPTPWRAFWGLWVIYGLLTLLSVLLQRLG